MEKWKKQTTEKTDNYKGHGKLKKLSDNGYPIAQNEKTQKIGSHRYNQSQEAKNLKGDI